MIELKYVHETRIALIINDHLNHICTSAFLYNNSMSKMFTGDRFKYSVN